MNYVIISCKILIFSYKNFRINEPWHDCYCECSITVPHKPQNYDWLMCWRLLFFVVVWKWKISDLSPLGQQYLTYICISVFPMNTDIQIYLLSDISFSFFWYMLSNGFLHWKRCKWRSFFEKISEIKSPFEFAIRWCRDCI